MKEQLTLTIPAPGSPRQQPSLRAVYVAFIAGIATWDELMLSIERSKEQS